MKMLMKSSTSTAEVSNHTGKTGILKEKKGSLDHEFYILNVGPLLMVFFEVHPFYFFNDIFMCFC